MPTRGLFEQAEEPERLSRREREGEFARRGAEGTLLDHQLGDFTGRNRVEGRVPAIEQVQLCKHLNEFCAVERDFAGAFDDHRSLLGDCHVTARIELDELLDLEGEED